MWGRDGLWGGLRGPRIAEVVSWPVGRVRLWRRLGSLWDLHVDLATMLDVGGFGPLWGLAAFRVPARAGAAMAVPPAVIRDLGTRDAWDVVVFVDHLELRRRTWSLAPTEEVWPGGSTVGPRTPVQLRPWRIAAASYQGVFRRSMTDPLARWSVDLVDSDGVSRLRLEGRWITLAWIGHLHGWASPVDGR